MAPQGQMQEPQKIPLVKYTYSFFHTDDQILKIEMSQWFKTIGCLSVNLFQSDYIEILVKLLEDSEKNDGCLGMEWENI